jgi:phosphatidylserine decarboxylase
VTRVRDRETGVVTAERVFGGNALTLLYGGRFGRLVSGTILCRRFPNSLYGWLQRRPASGKKIPAFVQSLGIDPSEAELPLEQYESLDDFFTRRLKPQSRPVDPDPARLVSPADGRALVYPRLDEKKLNVKTSPVSLAELLGDNELAGGYSGGAAIVIRLAPADYHRFHFPDCGVASVCRRIEGRLHSVHPIALAAGAPSFRNKREVTMLESRGFGTLALLEIGALCVGTIVQTYRPGPVSRGEEKGLFRFGGSTVVVLATEGQLQIDEDLVAASAEGMETRVKMGTGLARRI